jgi:hypothetical protein
MKYLRFLYIGLLLSGACKKGPTPPVDTAPVIDIAVNHAVDTDAFIPDSISYQHPAGYTYGINSLVYYLSDICLIREDSSNLRIKEHYYVDARIPLTNHFSLENLPAGTFIGLSFNIGLTPGLNKTNALPVISENINMQWPDLMGGGYHFIKLEGLYIDSSGTFGYAMHIGTDSCLTPIRLFKSIILQKNTLTSLGITMNINEWFRSPAIFDFEEDGNYIMGDMKSMKKFAGNGIDVFNF